MGRKHGAQAKRPTARAGRRRAFLIAERQRNRPRPKKADKR